MPSNSRNISKKSARRNIVQQPWGAPLSQHDLDLLHKLITSPRPINTVDIPEITTNTFTNKSGIAALFKPYKQQITLRLDSDIIAWARKSGSGYQSRINAALRQVMSTEAKAETKHKPVASLTQANTAAKRIK